MPRVEENTGDEPEELEVVEVAPGDFRRLNEADRKAMADQIAATSKRAAKDTGEVPSTAPTTTDVEVPLTPEADVPPEPKKGR
jgi:hypothetical protein